MTQLHINNSRLSQPDLDKIQILIERLTEAHQVVITTNDGELSFGEWDIEPVTGAFDNQFLRLHKSEGKTTFTVYFTEDGVASGLWLGDKFVCTDADGEMMQFELKTALVHQGQGDPAGASTGPLVLQLPFARNSFSEGYICLVVLDVAADAAGVVANALNPADAALEAIARAVTAWIKTTQAGASLWEESMQDLNIGDLDLNCAFDNEDLKTLLKGEGLVVKVAFGCNFEHSIDYDTILVEEDEPELEGA